MLPDGDRKTELLIELIESNELSLEKRAAPLMTELKSIYQVQF